ncbi:UNVERIFIED_CONTAM: FT-interacting protein 1 [Sesamum radiatum]|uniref:FT-interacting protein 1 n=1 Tax=Sesamum radiatum TaxID=300843 RepID=A0AAW2LE28_SESRA
MNPSNPQDDYKIKDTKPQLGERWPHGGVRGGGGWISSDRVTSTYDLVEQMYYLYVRVVKARDLPTNPVTGSCDPYVEVKLGNYKGKTQHFEKKMNPEWNQVFAFAKDKIQSTDLEVFVRDREMVGRDDYLGKVVFDMNEVPTRVPPDSPLAPQWYRLEDRRGENKSQLPQVLVKAQVGNQILKTKLCPTRTANPFWNEDLIFVAAEPFEEQLVLTVENKVAPSKDELVGRIGLPLHIFERRLDHRPVHSRWFNLQKFGFGVLEGDRRKEHKFSTRIHLRACLEGGYHVLDESTMYISDQRPTARQLWKQPIGFLKWES